MLTGYALTLLAFLFFGRYFQGNYLGYILAVATPVLFLRAEAQPAKRRVARSRVARAQRETAVAAARAPVATPVPIAVPAPEPETATSDTPGEPLVVPAPAGSAVD
jgi:hypothetical protein